MKATALVLMTAVANAKSCNFSKDTTDQCPPVLSKPQCCAFPVKADYSTVSSYIKKDAAGKKVVDEDYRK
jgi:hypothetical protein